ncbi:MULTISPECIES: GFA family protein [unclassified Haematobacter]|uniref:GFA family protein n=1 Tax=unclassified Haematobacter TaxID=2640585 RepID=UPI0025BE21BD|nr:MULTISPECIES: GFA family protein [unclassified Haematobacter]
MEQNDERLEGACHCGKVRFRVRLAGGLNAARRCDCSLCAMRGAVTLSARLADFTLLEGVEVLRTYRFNTGVAEHHFCGNCGIYTHHKRRSNPDQFGVNAACLGISPFDFAEVQVNDGVHHPSDGNESRVMGVLRFEHL